MMELAAVLLIKRTIEFRTQPLSLPDDKGINSSVVKTSKTHSHEVVLCKRKSFDEENPSTQNLENTSVNSVDQRQYSITDVIDFSALLIFFLSYIIFNGTYMMWYMS